MANKPLLYTITALIAVGSVSNYFALAAFFPDDPLVARGETPSSEATQTAPPTETSEYAAQVIAGRCNMEYCGWFRIERQATVLDKPEGLLIQLTTSYGTTEYKGDNPSSRDTPPNVEWDQPRTYHVLCSKRMPMFIGDDGRVEPLNVIDPPNAGEDQMLLWRGVCKYEGDKGLPNQHDIDLYQTAIEGRSFRDPTSIFGSLPSYPSWLIGKWGWHADDPQCLDSHTGFLASHSLDHYEQSGRWMMVGGKLWTAWDPFIDDEGRTESNQLERQDANHISMDGEVFFRCGT